MTAATESATSLTVACIQTRPVIGEIDTNLRRQAELIELAAGASLVVLPECSTTGYCFASAEEAAEVAEDVSSRTGPAMSMWSEVCATEGLHMVAGVVERDGGHIYNTAVLVGPSGLVGRYRKTHLWGPDLTNFTPGNLGFPVFDTPVGRIGMQICYDGWFPECVRLEAVQGADIICVPANWVPVPTQDPNLPTMATMLSVTAAHTNLVYIAAANRVGVERGQPFIGRSIIVDHTGSALAGPASSDSEQVISARIDPIGSRALRRGNPFNQPLRDRRLDLYAEALGSAHEPGDY